MKQCSCQGKANDCGQYDGGCAGHPPQCNILTAKGVPRAGSLRAVDMDKTEIRDDERGKGQGAGVFLRKPLMKREQEQGDDEGENHNALTKAPGYVHRAEERLLRIAR